MAKNNLYREEFVRVAAAMCRLGATYMELAQEFKVSKRTIINWTHQHSEFAHACALGASKADDRVERGLYERAVGYTFEAEEIHIVGGKVVRLKVLKHLPPDPNAAAKWLHNRRPENWREKQHIEHSGEVGVSHARELSDAELQSIASGSRDGTPGKAQG